MSLASGTPPQGRMMMQPIQIKATTAAEASAIYCAKRAAKASSRFPDGDWNGHRISFNGRIWEAGKSWDDGAKAIYNPGGVTPAIWADSTVAA
jgi:hypothetical protein